VLTTLGVSNVSFGLAPRARAALNSVFLYHCVEAGLDSAILNPAHVVPYFEIDAETRRLAEDLIFDRRTPETDPLAAFIAHFEGVSAEVEQAADPTAEMEPAEALHWMILHRKKEGIEALVDAAIRGRVVRAESDVRTATYAHASEALTPQPPLPQGERGSWDRWNVPAQLQERMKQVAREFRKEPTASEALLWEALRGRRLDGLKFRRQQPVGPFVVDFYCASERLVVEVDGGIHEAQRDRDRERQQLLESLGLRFIRIPAHTVEHDLTAALAAIRNALRSAPPLPLWERGLGGEGPGGEVHPAPGSGSLSAAAVDVLNHVLLPAMKEVGDKFGAGELILPFVLQSAEVMKRAVARLETYLEKAEGQTKGTVVLATVYGDVHDIGKSLVNTILTNNGYTVVDLGKQVPVNTILEKAVEVNADAIGLSALLVSTSKQMPLCAKELEQRGLHFPLLVGGAAINPSFVRSAAMVSEGAPYAPGMFYCKDAFEGLAVMERLQDTSGREEFVRRHNEEMLRREAEYRARQAKAESLRPASRENPAVAPAEVPAPPFWGWKRLDAIPVDEVVSCIDLNTLYRMQWGARNLKGAEWERVLREEFEPRLKRYTLEARTRGWLRPRAVYGYFPAGRDGDELVVFDPAERSRELGRFRFPRQQDRERLCLADYFRPLNGNGPEDVVALQVVTSGDRAAEFVAERTQGGEYGEGYFLHGFSVQTAEGTAEWLNRRVRQELGLEGERGLRYSWGYPACPDVEQHGLLFKLLPVEEAIGVSLTSAFQLDPEQSTAAIVVHHPAAKYFAA
jgi:methylmalonyl-CoA mutase cobalamin-binding domain/chain